MHVCVRVFGGSRFRAGFKHVFRCCPCVRESGSYDELELRGTRLGTGRPASMCTLSRADTSLRSTLHRHSSTQKSVVSSCERDGRGPSTIQGRRLTVRSTLCSDPGDCAVSSNETVCSEPGDVNAE